MPPEGFLAVLLPLAQSAHQKRRICSFLRRPAGMPAGPPPVRAQRFFRVILQMWTIAAVAKYAGQCYNMVNMAERRPALLFSRRAPGPLTRRKPARFLSSINLKSINALFAAGNPQDCWWQPVDSASSSGKCALCAPTGGCPPAEKCQSAIFNLTGCMRRMREVRLCGPRHRQSFRKGRAPAPRGRQFTRKV